MTQLNLDTRLYANDLFGSLRPEEEQELDRKLEVKSNPNLEYLVKKYERFMEKSNDFFEAEKLYKKLKFDNNYLTSKDIEEFSIVIGKYQELRNFSLSGYYLSRAINDSSDKEFTIHTKHLDSLINDFGYKNKKNITINGNAGDWAGHTMINGIITVNGNAGYFVGFLMKNGSITVNGNAGDWVGWGMYNGIIHLNGDYGSLSDFIKGGNIYHKGKLIVENGERVK